MNLKNTFQRNLILGSLLSAFILVLVSALSWAAVSQLIASQKAVKHTQDVKLKLENLISLLKDVETGQRGYLLTQRKDFLEPYEKAKAVLWDEYDALGGLISDNPEQIQDWKRMNDIIKTRISFLEVNINTMSQTATYQTGLMLKGKAQMDLLRSIIDIMMKREDTLLEQRNSVLGFYSSIVPWIIVLAALCAIIITLYFYVRLKRGLKQNIAIAESLQEQNENMERRTEAIQNISKDIAGGNYFRRISKEDLE